MNDANHGIAINSLYSKMTRWQLLATLITSVVAYLMGGMHAFLSVLAGGTSVVLGAFIATKVAARTNSKADPSAILINLLKAEAVKIMVIAVALFVVFKLYQQLVPVGLIAGLAAAALFSGAALAKTNEPI